MDALKIQKKKKNKNHTKNIFFTTFSKRFCWEIYHGRGGLQIQEKPSPCVFCEWSAAARGLSGYSRA